MSLDAQLIVAPLRARHTDIVTRWLALVAGTPWAEVPAEHRVDGLEPTLDAIVDTLRAGDLRTIEGRLRVARPAAGHGRTRARQGVPMHVLPTEYSLLRFAVWSALHQQLEPPLQIVLFAHIDYALSLGTRASMIGYHADELESAGPALDEALERLCRDP